MGYDVELTDLQEQGAATVHGHVPPAEIADFLGGAFDEVAKVALAQGVQVTGPPFARYGAVATETWEVEAGFPVGGQVTPEGRVEPSTLLGGSTARALHRGDYSDLGAAYAAVESWMFQHGYATRGAPWESYLDDPQVEQPRTEVCFPCHPVAPADA